MDIDYGLDYVWKIVDLEEVLKDQLKFGEQEKIVSDKARAAEEYENSIAFYRAAARFPLFINYEFPQLICRLIEKYRASLVEEGKT